MLLAKPHIDVGLFTGQREAQLAFRQQTVGLAFEPVQLATVAANWFSG